MKNVPGRKTDVKDCQWIQQLHSNGLLCGSFRPTDDFVRLRAYVRQRRQLSERAGIHLQLMQKALIQMNVQLNLVLSNSAGKTGLLIIQAIIRGERDPVKLSGHRQKKCQKSIREIAKALEGNWREEHIFALRQAYEAYEFYHKQIIECEEAIKELIPALTIQKSLPVLSHPIDAWKQFSPIDEPTDTHAPKKNKCIYNRSPYHFDVAAQMEQRLGINLTEIPGIEGNSLLAILSETGTDMSKWKTVKHFTSWLGLCPGSKISGGKVLSSKTKPTNNRAAHALRLAANTLHRSKSALGAFFRRMRSRLGAPKAITATAHKLAKILYQMLKHGRSYKEVGADYYDKVHQQRVLTNLRKRAAEFNCILIPNVQSF